MKQRYSAIQCGRKIALLFLVTVIFSCDTKVSQIWIVHVPSLGLLNIFYKSLDFLSFHQIIIKF